MIAIMNRQFFLFFVIVVLAVTFVACVGGGANITMVTENENISFYMAGSGNVTIDWGDENVANSMLYEERSEFSHNYSIESSYIIKITGENITYLNCSNNGLTGLDVSKNSGLRELNCGSNQLIELDVSSNTALTHLEFGANRITNIDISKNTGLTYVSYWNNQFTSLDVSKNTALTELRCANNKLISLDVSNNIALTELRCHNNQLTSLNVSNNNILERLWCYGNQLTSLDVSNNNMLGFLWCSTNQLTTSELNTLFGTLHSNSVSPFSITGTLRPIITAEGKLIRIGNNPGTNDCDRNIAVDKGWSVDDINITATSVQIQI